MHSLHLLERIRRLNGSNIIQPYFRQILEYRARNAVNSGLLRFFQRFALIAEIMSSGQQLRRVSLIMTLVTCRYAAVAVAKSGEGRLSVRHNSVTTRETISSPAMQSGGIFNKQDNITLTQVNLAKLNCNISLICGSEDDC